MNNNSKIRNREYMKQIKDFSRLKWGTITPTDIDVYFEINNKLFIFIEIKFQGRLMAYGQKLGLERLIDVVQKEKKAVLIIARHDEKSDIDINIAECKVIKYRYRKKWIEVNKQWKVKDFCDWFIETELGYLPK